jgi:hypothetical protein
MVDLLALIQIIVHVWLCTLADPHEVPVVPLCLLEPIVLQDGLDQLSVGFDQFEK